MLTVRACQRYKGNFLFTKWVPLTRRVIFGKWATRTNWLFKMEFSTWQTTLCCHFSETSDGIPTRMWSWRQRLTAYQQEGNSFLMSMAVRFLWESSEENDENTHAAIFVVKFGNWLQVQSQNCRESTIFSFNFLTFTFNQIPNVILLWRALARFCHK